MSATVKRYLPDGSTRAIWDDTQADRERRHGVAPVRASRIEVIPAGPQAGRFHVDFTPLAQASGNSDYCCCLRETFARYDTANARELDWLRVNYVLRSLPDHVRT